MCKRRRSLLPPEQACGGRRDCCGYGEALIARGGSFELLQLGAGFGICVACWTGARTSIAVTLRLSRQGIEESFQNVRNHQPSILIVESSYSGIFGYTSVP
jgi:hypothetical protein